MDGLVPLTRLTPTLTYSTLLHEHIRDNGPLQQVKPGLFETLVRSMVRFDFLQRRFHCCERHLYPIFPPYALVSGCTPAHGSRRPRQLRFRGAIRCLQLLHWTWLLPR